PKIRFPRCESYVQLTSLVCPSATNGAPLLVIPGSAHGTNVRVTGLQIPVVGGGDGGRGAGGGGGGGRGGGGGGGGGGGAGVPPPEPEPGVHCQTSEVSAPTISNTRWRTRSYSGM